jgi:hypothetical protein
MGITKEKASEFPIYKLVYCLANIERRMFELKKQQVGSRNTGFKKLRNKRAIYRNELLLKLTEWKKNPQKYELTYSNTMNENYDDTDSE